MTPRAQWSRVGSRASARRANVRNDEGEAGKHGDPPEQQSSPWSAILPAPDQQEKTRQYSVPPQELEGRQAHPAQRPSEECGTQLPA